MKGQPYRIEHGMLDGNDIKEWVGNMKGAGDGRKEKDEKLKTKRLRRTCHRKTDGEVMCRKQYRQNKIRQKWSTISMARDQKDDADADIYQKLFFF